jgi:HTH-type transcriptional regulator / antitoxin HipB
MSRMRNTRLHGPERLGRSVRLRRLEKGLSQNALAERLGVGRKWVIRLEAGNPKAELGLVLKALDALGLRASVSDERPSPADAGRSEPSRLDEVFRRLQRSAPPERK